MRRIWILLIPLLIAPLIALSVLAWWLAGRVQDELLVAQRKQHEALLVEFERRFAEQFEASAARVLRWGQDVLAGSENPSPIPGAAWAVMADRSGRWYYPSAVSGGSENPGEPAIAVENLDVLEDLGLALGYERSQPSIGLAAEKYEEILRRETIPPPVKARVLLGLARCAQKAGQSSKALDYYRQVMTEFADLRDETGVNFGAEASAAYLKLIAAHSQDDLPEAWRRHTDALLDGHYPMSPVLAVNHLTEALAAWPVSAQEEQDQARRSRLEARIDELNEMNEAVAGILSGPPIADPRLEHRGSRVIIVQSISAGDRPAFAAAAFSHKEFGGRLQGILADLESRESGRLGLRDEFGETIAGTNISPATLSTQLSLSRWGLPWIVEVGFTDLFATELQSHQRHLLLTGSIVLLLLLIATGGVLSWHLVRREIELSKLKSDFVDNVSHELRTPVTSIKMFSEMLQSGQTTDPERQQEYFRLLASESSRLARMIDNVLNFSRIMAGRLRLNRRPTDMAAFLTEQQAQLELQARTTGHRLHLHLGRDLPVCFIDPDAISRALANLVSNATKYSSKEQAIVLTAQRRDGVLSLMVRDRGVGIPEKELPHVFERFYRAASPDGEHVQGTGLGLTIVKDTVERHGGRIRIESRPGEGTIVEMLIPIE